MLRGASKAVADAAVAAWQRSQRAVQGVRTLQGFARIAEHEKGKTIFTGYYAGGFSVNNVQVPGSVLAQSDLYLMWRPRTWEEVTVESLTFLELIKPAPESVQVVVFGCGAVLQPLPHAVSEYLHKKGIRSEVLDSRNATGYFNVLQQEGRVVVGALLAHDPSIPLAQAMPQQKESLLESGLNSFVARA